MRVVRCLVALCLFASVGLTATAYAAKVGMRLTASPARVEVGQRTVLTVAVTPKAKGRPIVVERRSGTRWVRIAATRTNARGVATVPISFTSPGRIPLRAVAKKHRGQRQRTATTVLTVLPKAAGTVTLGVDGATVNVNQPVRLVARLRPAEAGRGVLFQRQSGGGWTNLGRAVTNTQGLAALTTTFAAAGPVTVRAVAEVFRGRGQTVGTTTLSVRPGGGGGPEGDPFPRDGELTLRAPEWVVTGATFDLEFAVTAGAGGIPAATLVVTPPEDGQRVTPPADLEPVTGGLGAEIAGLAAGTTQTPVLRWTAPDSPGELQIGARLTIGSVQRAVNATVQVVAEPEGGGTFGDALEMFRESREAPAEPEMVKDFPAQVLAARPVPSFEAAYAAAQTFIASSFDETQQSAWDEFLELTAEDPELVDDVLATAFGSDHMVAALAIALRGHQVAPNDPVHLSNAAVAASRLDRPEWAIAFGRKAGEIPAGPSVGVDQEAVRLANIAHAWALMADYGRAEQTLRRALLMAPQSALLHQELAAVQQFSAGKNVALEEVRRSLRKTDEPDPLEDHPDNAPYRFSRVDAADIWDLSRGGGGTLVLPQLPGSQEHLLALGGPDGYYDAAYWSRQQEFLALQQQVTELTQKYRELDLHPMTHQRIQDVLRHIGADGNVEVYEAYLAERAARQAALKHNSCPPGLFRDHPFCNHVAGPPACSATAGLYQEWATRMGTWRAALVNYFEVAWPVFTGLQANLSEDVAYRLAAARARTNVMVTAASYVQAMRDAGFAFRDYNVEPESSPRRPCLTPDGTASDAGWELAEPTPTGCAPGSDLAKTSFELDLMVVRVSTTCETVKAEVTAGGYGLLRAFARFEGSWRGNGSTFIVGSKGTVPTVGAFESAVYLQTDGTGGFKDAGLEVGRREPLTRIELEPWSDKVRMSAMSTFTGE